MTPPVVDTEAGGETSLLSDDAPVARVTTKASSSKKS